MRVRAAITVVTAAAVGAAADAIAAKRVFDTGIFVGKEPSAAASALLEIALDQAGKGTWERLAVARVHYLAGNTAAAAEIIDGVIAGKADESDWMRIGAIYYDAGDWDKAAAACQRAIDANPKDAENLAKVGAFYNLRGDRDEELFVRAFERKPDELWVTVYAAASYAGVRPQD